MRTLNGLCLVLIISMLGACKTETTASLPYKDVKLMAEAPFFEGSNTIQGTLETHLGTFAEEHHIKMDDIVSARLKSVTLTTDSDSSNFDLLSSMTMQFASDKSDMIEVALLTSIPQGKKSVELKPASEQKNLIDVLKQDQFTIVIDALFTKDSEKNMEIKANLEFELTYKQ
jgi:hypothetical protein